MANFKDFDHIFHKAISNGYSSEDAFLYAAKKYVEILYDFHRLEKDEHAQNKVVKQAFRVYDSERLDGGSRRSARTTATSYIEESLEDYADQDRILRDRAGGEHKWSRGGRRNEGAFDDFDQMHDSLPDRGHSPLHKHYTRYDKDRANRCHNFRVPESCSGSGRPEHKDYATPRPRSPPSGASRRPSFFAPPEPVFSVPPCQDLPPMPAGVGQFFFPSPQFPNEPWYHQKHPQYSTSSFRCDPSSTTSRYETYNCYPSEPSSSKSNQRFYRTQEFQPSSGNARYRTARPPFNSHHSDYASKRNAPSRPSYDPPRSNDYCSSRTYADAPPHSSRPHSPPPSNKDDGNKPMTCYYRILGISPLASADDIRKAYRKLSMKHHPDRVMSANKAKATDKMAEINQANDVLSDAKKRMYYDQTGCIP